MLKESNGFHFRSFISLLLFLSFSFSAFSGLVLFLRPEGSLADWHGWSVLGLDKKQWEGVHAVLVLVFFITTLVHLIYNWKALVAYLRRKKARFAGMFNGLGMGWELVAALVLIAVIIAGTLLRWPPFLAVAKLRTAIKDGKYLNAVKPPVVNAHQLTVAELCVVSGISEQHALANASVNGVQIRSSSETIEAVAKRNRLTPEKVFILLRGN
jgi:hypothetical protein